MSGRCTVCLANYFTAGNFLVIEVTQKDGMDGKMKYSINTGLLPFDGYCGRDARA